MFIFFSILKISRNSLIPELNSFILVILVFWANRGQLLLLSLLLLFVIVVMIQLYVVVNVIIQPYDTVLREMHPVVPE